MSLTEKIAADTQKNNLIALREQLAERNLNSSVLRKILHPDSSNILKEVLRKINEGVGEKVFYTWPSPDCESHLTTRLANLGSREKTVLCFFPNYSSRIDCVISDLPVLEVSSDMIEEWYKLAKSLGLHFFLCCSNDFREGIALDVYEADPGVHGVAGAVCDLFYWKV